MKYVNHIFSPELKKYLLDVSFTIKMFDEYVGAVISSTAGWHNDCDQQAAVSPPIDA